MSICFKIKEVLHWTKFRYRSIETDVLAHAMQRVTNIGLAQIISETIWARMGVEEDGNITTDSSGCGLACGGITTS